MGAVSCILMSPQRSDSVPCACSADASKELRCLPLPQPAYEFSDTTCNKIAYQGVCGERQHNIPIAVGCARPYLEHKLLQVFTQDVHGKKWDLTPCI